MKDDTLLVELRQQARALGFDRLGVIPAVPARRLAAYRHWLAQQMHGQMGYLARPDRVARREDLQVILPGVQTIICVGLAYFTQSVPPFIAQDAGRGRISNYAWGQDYHAVMTPRLEMLADWLVTAVSPSPAPIVHRVYVDTGAILERDHAETAGLGFTGKNTLLIDPQAGSWLFLGEILTTRKFTTAPPSPVIPACGTCHRCLDACPTHAFPAPYVLDARRCISYLTIELKEWIPPQVRPLLGNWVYGCDVCQEVCPFNRFARPSRESAFWPTMGTTGIATADPLPIDWDVVAPPLPQLLALDEATFPARFAGSPVRRIGRVRLVRNACVAAGNWGSETAVPFLLPLLHAPEPILRGHAAWALRQIGGAVAETAVAHARRTETEVMVRQEMQ